MTKMQELLTNSRTPQWLQDGALAAILVASKSPLRAMNEAETLAQAVREYSLGKMKMDTTARAE